MVGESLEAGQKWRETKGEQQLLWDFLIETGIHAQSIPLTKEDFCRHHAQEVQSVGLQHKSHLLRLGRDGRGRGTIDDFTVTRLLRIFKSKAFQELVEIAG